MTPGEALSRVGGATSALDPAGPAAARIAGLGWVLIGLGGAIYLVVMALLVAALLRARRRGAPTEAVFVEEPTRGANALVAVGGAAVPAVVMVGLMALLLNALSAFAQPAVEPLEVEITGHQWWWEVRYPGADATTANELHLPVGRPVRLRLASADVIHSLWVPRLHGKMDLVPGRATTLTIQADRPGVYRGPCAEFCGKQHALMTLTAVAHEPAGFDAWLTGQAAPARRPSNPASQRGLGLFVSSGCVACHRIAFGESGDAPPATAGPDLTHVGSRRTIAAGALESSRANLARWILDPQGVKHGSKMPAVGLGEEEAEAIAAYLAELE
jgi:cytochrome c oxidase subunit 2